MRLGTWTPQTIAQQESSKIFRFVQSLTIFPLRTRNHSFKSSGLLDAPSAVSLSLAPEAVTFAPQQGPERCGVQRGNHLAVLQCCSAAVLQTDDGLIIHAGLQCTGQWSRHHSGATCDNDCECATVIGRGVRAVCSECRYNKHGQRGHSVLPVECARCQQPSTHRHRHGVVITRLRPRAACSCGLVVV